MSIVITSNINNLEAGSEILVVYLVRDILSGIKASSVEKIIDENERIGNMASYTDKADSPSFDSPVNKYQAMGCCSSNLANQVAIQPENRIQPAPVKEEKSSGLSNKDIEIIQANWSLVSTDLQGHGNTLFRRLFEQHPGMMELFYFANEKNCDLEEVMQDPRLHGHALNVMNTVSVAVSSLHDLPELVPVLKNLGAIHAKFKLKPEHYEAVASALLWTLEKGLGNQFDDKAKRAWACVFDVVAKNMREGACEVEKQEFVEAGETRSK